MLLNDLLPSQESAQKLLFSVNNLGSNLNPNLNLEITAIEIDSKAVTQGAVFFALQGRVADGLQFVGDAVAKGAVAIVCRQGRAVDIKEAIGVRQDNGDSIVVIESVNPHDLLVLCLRRFYCDLPDNLFAVTGTNGKTSTVEFVRQMLEMSGKKAASIGTLGVVCNHRAVYQEICKSILTTSDIVSLYKNLTVLKKHNINDVVIEISSIGIEQGRVDGLEFVAAAFTNFTEDHLDYHLNMANYFDSKMLLFSKFLKSRAGAKTGAKIGLAIINADIDQYNIIAKICSKYKHNVFSYGRKGEDVRLITVEYKGDSQKVIFEINGQKYQTQLSMVGDFQAMNMLCALSIVNFYYPFIKKNLSRLVSQFSNLKTAQGRMEKVAILQDSDAEIYIDFAHSPDALKHVLISAKKFAKSRLLVLFGCGGNRDRKKRAEMGKIACDLADLVIVTDDNPRYENPAQIRKEILSGCHTHKVVEIDNRKDAIQKAIAMLGWGDVLIIAGKGHEQYQIIGQKKLPFNERQIIQEILMRV